MQGLNVIHHLYHKAAVQTLWRQDICMEGQANLEVKHSEGKSEKNTYKSLGYSNQNKSNRNWQSASR